MGKNMMTPPRRALMGKDMGDMKDNESFENVGYRCVPVMCDDENTMNCFCPTGQHKQDKLQFVSESASDKKKKAAEKESDDFKKKVRSTVDAELKKKEDFEAQEKKYKEYNDT